MVDEPHIAYVFQHYEHLFTQAEREAWFGMGIFGVGGPYSDDGESLASMSDLPEVVELGKKPRDQFRRDVAERLVRNYPNDIFFNYCPLCGGLCRTPKAKQCPHCKHHWHCEAT